MERWKLVTAAGILVALVGVLMAFGVLGSGFTASAIEPSPNTRGNSANMSVHDYEDLSDSDRRIFNEMRNQTVTTPPSVYNQSDAETVAVTTNNTTYQIKKVPHIRSNGLYTTGLGAVIAGLLTVFYGVKQRDIQELQERIEEIESLTE